VVTGLSRGLRGPVRGQTDIFEALSRAEPKLRADGQLEGQTDIYDVLDGDDEGGGDDRAA
jgi:hypothetical protein